MTLTNMFQEDRIIIDMKASTKQEAIEELVQVAAVGSGIEMDIEKTVASFMERESLGSTGIGLGVAVPHIRIESISQCAVVFGKSKAGVEYAAIDNKPVHLFFMIFGPLKEERQENYLKLMASISKMLRDEGVRAKLIEAETPAQAMELFNSQD